MLDLDPYRIDPGQPAGLAARPTRITRPYKSRSDYLGKLAKRIARISKLQTTLYAERRKSLLVILQATDAAGKDGVIRHVFSGVNPQGCQVHDFGPPSPSELAQDFLWRTTLRLPAHGCIGVFNRSYYEEVLVVRAHREMLVAEGVDAGAIGDGLWEGRYRSIRDHEAHLCRSGTKVLKIFLHLSKSEQRRRFLRRIGRPDKHWKINPADISERARWDVYGQAYEDCLSATGSREAPWFAIPADDKKTARLLVAEAVLRALEALDPAYPATSPELQDRLDRLRVQLEAEDA